MKNEFKKNNLYHIAFSSITLLVLIMHSFAMYINIKSILKLEIDSMLIFQLLLYVLIAYYSLIIINKKSLTNYKLAKFTSIIFILHAIIEYTNFSNCIMKYIRNDDNVIIITLAEKISRLLSIFYYVIYICFIYVFITSVNYYKKRNISTFKIVLNPEI
jgi:hypothetical protein